MEEKGERMGWKGKGKNRVRFKENGMCVFENIQISAKKMG